MRKTIIYNFAVKNVEVVWIDYIGYQYIGHCVDYKQFMRSKVLAIYQSRLFLLSTGRWRGPPVGTHPYYCHFLMALFGLPIMENLLKFEGGLVWRSFHCSIQFTLYMDAL